MGLKKITAIIREDLLTKVEKNLRQASVRGLSVSRIKGYGEYANYFTPDLETGHAKIEIFATDAKVDAIVTAIMNAASTGLAGDGIVAVQPVEKIFRVRTRSEVSADNSYI